MHAQGTMPPHLQLYHCVRLQPTHHVQCMCHVFMENWSSVCRPQSGLVLHKHCELWRESSSVSLPGPPLCNAQQSALSNPVAVHQSCMTHASYSITAQYIYGTYKIRCDPCVIPTCYYVFRCMAPRLTLLVRTKPTQWPWSSVLL